MACLECNRDDCHCRAGARTYDVGRGCGDCIQCYFGAGPMDGVVSYSLADFDTHSVSRLVS